MRRYFSTLLFVFSWNKRSTHTHTRALIRSLHYMYCIDFYIASFVSHANCCADTLNFSVSIATTSCLCAIVVVVARAIAIVIMAVIIFWYWHLIFDVLLFFALSSFYLCASHTLCLFLTSFIPSVSFYFESIHNLISKVPINFRNNFFYTKLSCTNRIKWQRGWITKKWKCFYYIFTYCENQRNIYK